MNNHTASYKEPGEEYLEKFRQARKKSFWNNIPWTELEWFSGFKGLYGYTIRQSGKIGMNKELEFDEKEKIDTDIHESLHTNDERETKYLTEELIKVLFPEAKRYKAKAVPEYRV